MQSANKTRSTQEEASPFVEARVTGVCDDVLGLSGAAGTLTARRAASCLLMPAAGDTVLATCVADGSWVVLAVLVRGAADPIVSLPADALLRTEAGGLTLAAQTSLALAGGERVSVVSPALEVHAEQANGSFSVLRAAAGLVETTASRIRSIADYFETVADTLRQRAGSMYREVKDLDHLKAGQVNYRAETVFNIRGKHSVLSAEGEVKIDGTRVHLG
ncbi:MAG TPA: DUF3540 domain-containing protein [Gammaproteobacteria bacterium]|nr:DUF3540 domain-containing protein [Gammaproteobacteria bacterium]